MVYTQLAEEAIKAKLKAHPPYSNFHVGAALLTENNKLYLAYLEGERKFKAMAIASDAPDFCPPCGACRQVISDLCGNIDVIMVNHKKEIKVLKLSDLLPFAFGDENLR